MDAPSCVGEAKGGGLRPRRVAERSARNARGRHGLASESRLGTSARSVYPTDGCDSRRSVNGREVLGHVLASRECPLRGEPSRSSLPFRRDARSRAAESAVSPTRPAGCEGRSRPPRSRGRIAHPCGRRCRSPDLRANMNAPVVQSQADFARIAEGSSTRSPSTRRAKGTAPSRVRFEEVSAWHSESVESSGKLAVRRRKLTVPHPDRPTVAAEQCTSSASVPSRNSVSGFRNSTQSAVDRLEASVVPSRETTVLGREQPCLRETHG